MWNVYTRNHPNTSGVWCQLKLPHLGWLWRVSPVGMGCDQPNMEARAYENAADALRADAVRIAGTLEAE